MTVEVVRAFLGWCTLINFGLLILMFGAFVFAKDWIRSVHGKWFSFDANQFDALWYQSIAIFKLGVILFNLTPYLALRIMG